MCKKWIIPLMPQYVPLMYAQLLIWEKKKILWKSVLSIKWLLGSEKMTDSFCSYEKWLFLSDINYEPLNWMFCCYPRKTPWERKAFWSSVTIKERQPLMGSAYLHFTTWGKKKKILWHSLVWEVGGGEKLGSIKVSLYEDQNIFPVEFYQTKRGDLFLWNLFLKRTGQLSSHTLISKDSD